MHAARYAQTHACMSSSSDCCTLTHPLTQGVETPVSTPGSVGQRSASGDKRSPVSKHGGRQSVDAEVEMKRAICSQNFPKISGTRSHANHVALLRQRDVCVADEEIRRKGVVGERERETSVK